MMEWRGILNLLDQGARAHREYPSLAQTKVMERDFFIEEEEITSLYLRSLNCRACCVS